MKMFIKIHYFCTSSSVTVKLGGGGKSFKICCVLDWW